MIKPAVLALLISIWLFAVFAPSVISLVNNEDNIFISLNLNEEEQQEQVKKDDSEEKILLENWLAQIHLLQNERILFSHTLQINFSSHAIEIPLPPPEFLIKQA
ncbi:hypothetical protein [uncultured Eudoraea sp.]|jgi:hypothetical protein|uniref:hypothetical protein n=1 Tax=uncultured Eudoraea sp. TaxID=1035614 RepID=UPI0026392915|nr:hypothetical protein [uncultured Eudoraea sp.]